MAALLGVPGLKKNLREIKKAIGTSGLRRAARAGARVIQQDARRRAPKRTGKLRRSIRVVNISGKNKTTGAATVQIGWLRDAFHGNFIHSGSKAHTIRASRKKVLVTAAGEFLGAKVSHPGIRANPFLTAAFDARKQEAERIVGETLRRQIERLG